MTIENKGRVLVEKGDVAGSINGSGYYLVMLDKKNHRAHRIVWELHNGPIPEGSLVDHEDRVKTNNRISNLRLATHSLNSRNRTAKLDSPLLGVVRRIRENADGSRYEFWYVRWKTRSGKSKAKSFGISRYGEELAKALAIQARMKANEEFEKEFQ